LRHSLGEAQLCAKHPLVDRLSVPQDRVGAADPNLVLDRISGQRRLRNREVSFTAWVCMGMVMMNMMSSTSMTSISGVTLMSIIGGGSTERATWAMAALP
jgi:hypothetical protein